LTLQRSAVDASGPNDMRSVTALPRRAGFATAVGHARPDLDRVAAPPLRGGFGKRCQNGSR